ncbi:MAG: hypothetical protein LBD62_00445 [Candidatus Margulisbacteria bacterium]|jgi:hypothetical protein|nr:hypothetical protein [Candidatus Margulisiibacteriota bacterium]
MAQAGRTIKLCTGSEHTHSFTDGYAATSGSDHTHTLSGGKIEKAGESLPFDNRPSYYTLIYIRKCA